MSDGNMLWGGRFEDAPDPDMLRLTRSTGVDMELLPYDIRATRAHARVLESAGLLSAEDADLIGDALDAISSAWEAGTLEPLPEDEDVHTVVERELTERLGDPGKRIHAGRSRNDLVATDLRLWCKDAAGKLRSATTELAGLIAELAEEHAGSLMPGFTHLQSAQPVSLGFHLLAHGFALARDVRRFETAAAAADESALGAGALAGTSLPLDPEIARSELGFERTFDNAMDAVASRDFAVDLVYACSTCAMTLSRIAEEIVIWCSPAFGFVSLPDAWSTGSSMMPQKRNPDMAELVRGRAAPVLGDLTALLALTKGLPLAYDRDLQEDKALVFGAVRTVLGSLIGMKGMLAGVHFDVERMSAAASAGGSWATDAAEILVERGVPFRTAHEAVGQIVRAWDQSRAPVPDDAALRAGHSEFRDGDAAMLHAPEGMRRRNSPGGTSPQRVKEQAGALRERLES